MKLQFPVSRYSTIQYLSEWSEESYENRSQYGFSTIFYPGTSGIQNRTATLPYSMHVICFATKRKAPLPAVLLLSLSAHPVCNHVKEDLNTELRLKGARRMMYEVERAKVS
jgi:hypothetical protein